MSSAQLKKFASVKPANIEWRDNLPYSLEFNDVYYSDSGALAESEHVFLKGCLLEEDWLTKPQDKFYLAELGFGSGLNFFNTADLWQRKVIQQSTFENKQLHYISIEKRPFSLNDFKRSCLSWPQFNFISNQLIQSYPSTSYGRFQIHFTEMNITLTLLYMPADEALADLIEESESQQNKIKIDHWFLDGFAPSKNETMWGDTIMRSVAALSKVGSRLATYSVAASVKNPIKEAGFTISKKIGFGRKREMLTARLENPMSVIKPNTINIKNESPWFNLSLSADSDRVAIIGGGIAACATAYQLALQGLKVDLFEAHSQIAKGASGAAAGIFHPQLTSDMNINSQFNWSAYLTLINFLASLTSQEKQKIILSQGVNRFLESTKIKQFLLDLSTSLNLTQWIKDSPKFLNNSRAIQFPDAAALDMAAFCQLLFDKIPSEQKTLQLNSQISDLRFVNGHWCFNANQKSHQYKQIVYCGGAQSGLLDQLVTWQKNISRGQTCFIHAPELSKKIKSTLCEKVYLVPRPNNNFHIGTTFENVSHVKQKTQLSLTSQREILTNTKLFLKDIGLVDEIENANLSEIQIEKQPLSGTFGYRLHSPDRLPFVGAAVDEAKLNHDFANMGQRRLTRQPNSFYNLPGLWLNTGYGSHGLLYSLLASQHLSSLISNDISPLNQQLSQALSPTSCVIKQLK